GPNKPWPAQIEDVKCAIRYLRANAKLLHVDPNEIGAWGHSAGGHLVDLLGLAGPSAGWDVGAYTNQSSKVQAVIDLAGPTNLPTMGTFGAAGVVQDSFISLLGDVPLNELGAALTSASPVTYVTASAPPFLIFHSNNDPIVSFKQSQDLAWDLSAAGDSASLVTVNGGGHLFTQKGGSPSPAQITDEVLQFFVKSLHAHP
ncbi:MAG TPA: alpha/beta hydrolase, partial [Acidimicrobiales bacterium]